MPTRMRVGRVSLYLHHGNWWVYFRDNGKPVRRKAGAGRDEAEQVAAQVNSQLATGAPTLASFTPVGVPELRRQFLDHHEHLLKSSLGTVRRYRAATQHLENFVGGLRKPPPAHEVKIEQFAAHLRTAEVSPNGHSRTARRRLRDKGIQFILQTCRAMYGFAARRRHLPPYAANPFAQLPIDRLKIEDAKPVFVFDADSEASFLAAADDWSFALHFTLAKTGMRPAELVHLLIEDMDLGAGWLRVRNKAELGWRIKTGRERAVPLISELVAVLRRVIGARTAGPVFLRRRFATGDPPPAAGGREALAGLCSRRLAAEPAAAASGTSRHEQARIQRGVWRDAGALKPDSVRSSFIRIARHVGRPQATCPKSWRHTFATLLQDANVDPLIRQVTLGHKPSGCGESALGMTGVYTHTRPETQMREIERALRLWPASLELARAWAEGGCR